MNSDGEQALADRRETRLRPARPELSSRSGVAAVILPTLPPAVVICVLPPATLCHHPFCQHRVCVCTATCQANLCTTLHATPRRKIKQTTSTFNTIDILVPPSHTHTYTDSPPSHAGSETKVRLFPSPSRMNSSCKKKRHCSSANQLCALS